MIGTMNRQREAIPNGRRQSARALSGLLLFALVLLAATGCGTPAKESFRPPNLAERNWQELIQLVGDFGPAGGEFIGDFENGRFQGYRYQAPTGAVAEVTLDRLGGHADPVLVFYGPQLGSGIWGSARRLDDDSGGDLNARLRVGPLPAGVYLFVATTREESASGPYRIALRCLEGCEGPEVTCPIVDSCGEDTICYSGFEVTPEGCPTCICNDECRADRDCGPEQACIRGNCIEYCTCRDPYDPVCGSDGVTYRNRCEAGCEGVAVVYPGACAEVCPALDCDLTCPSGYRRDEQGCEVCQCLEPCEACDRRVEPVCTRNGVTYQNRCLAECRGEQVAYSGECRPTCPELICDLECPDGYVRDEEGCPLCQCNEVVCPTEEAVCGADGLTYSSRCEADAAGVTVLFDSPCPPLCHGDADCPPEDYHCRSGSYGLTDCPLDSADCVAVCVYEAPVCTSLDATDVSASQCLPGDECGSDGVCESPCECAPVYYPVCGEDGRTYDSPCRARCAEVAVASYGPCCNQAVVDSCDVDCASTGYAVDRHGCELCECAEEAPCNCLTTVENQVCGDDGNWYDNECLMRCAGVRLAESEAVCRG